MKFTRRQFALTAGSMTAALFGLKLYNDRRQVLAEQLISLVKDPNGILDLPPGFSYKVLSRYGTKMSDGLHVPAGHDGMAAFATKSGKTILVRNHELDLRHHKWGAFQKQPNAWKKLGADQLYDDGRGKNPPAGGTTTVVYDTKTGKVEKHFLSLAGTVNNCCGGPTPWGSWITCEETEQRTSGDYSKLHGYAFEVPATDKVGLTRPIPLKAMGRFRREAVAISKTHGVVYQTEDQGDGLFYRFIPINKTDLKAGGKLQALALKSQQISDTRNWSKPLIKVGQKLIAEWIDVDDVEALKNDLRYRGARAGAAIFARGEGLWADGDTIYFACTTGGANQRGQIWKYTPAADESTNLKSKATLELFLESRGESHLDMADNLTVSPFGDLFVCEDGDNGNFVRGITQNGKIYPFAYNRMNSSEFAGACFSPDKSTMFVNIQNPGLTLAITGDWKKLDGLRSKAQ